MLSFVFDTNHFIKCLIFLNTYNHIFQDIEFFDAIVTSTMKVRMVAMLRF